MENRNKYTQNHEKTKTQLFRGTVKSINEKTNKQNSKYWYQVAELYKLNKKMMKKPGSFKGDTAQELMELSHSMTDVDLEENQ